MATQQTGWVTSDQHIFNTQTEAEAYESLQKYFQTQTELVAYDHENAFSVYEGWTRTMIGVTPTLLVTLTNFDHAIDADQLPEGFTMSGEYSQKASYQATSRESATFMFDYLVKHVTRFIDM